jgi:bacterioferritin-associated ferredoxin
MLIQKKTRCNCESFAFTIARMIVCICNNISSKVLDAYRAEGLSLDDVRSDYGLASNCGQCLATAERLMASAGVPMPAQRAMAESQLIAVSA